MRLKNILPITATLLLLLMGSCQKDAIVADSSMDTASDLLIDNTVIASSTTNKSSTVSSDDNHNTTNRLTSPKNGALNVPLDQTITAYFNDKISFDQIKKSTFTLSQATSNGSKDDSNGTMSVAGTVSFTNSTATFKPSANLSPNTYYTATITTKSIDKYGHSKEKRGYSWHFTTISNSPTILPTVTLTDPLNNATGVVFNKPVIVNFSEAMDPLTINASTFTVKQGLTAISGTITYSGTKATFTPAINLVPNSIYTVTITTGAKNLNGFALISNYTFNFTTAAAPDIIAPTVTLVDPLNNATGVAINKAIGVTFSESMNATTINATTFTLKQGTTAVAGTISYAGTKAIFTPVASLTASTVYTGTITTGAKDLAGNALSSNYTFSFTTAAPADITAPTVTLIDPTNNSTGVVINKAISVTFSEAMNAATINATTFTLKQGTTAVAGTVTYAGTKATFTPSANLLNGSNYTATITTGVTDLAGNALSSNYTFIFTTIAAADITAPTVTLLDPLSNATGVATNKVIGITFSEAMNAATLTTATFTLKQGTTAVSGAVAYSGTKATFTPSAVLIAGTVYTATITTGAKDLAGNALAANTSWSFTTAGTPPPPALSFATDVVPVLAMCENCHNHGWTPSAVASTYYTNLVNAGYVNPASYTTSTIYTKLSSGHPGSGSISTANTDKIINWMIQGSKNN